MKTYNVDVFETELKGCKYYPNGTIESWFFENKEEALAKFEDVKRDLIYDYRKGDREFEGVGITSFEDDYQTDELDEIFCFDDYESIAEDEIIDSFEKLEDEDGVPAKLETRKRVSEKKVNFQSLIDWILENKTELVRQDYSVLTFQNGKRNGKCFEFDHKRGRLTVDHSTFEHSIWMEEWVERGRPMAWYKIEDLESCMNY